MKTRNLKFNRIRLWILIFSFILGLTFLLNSYSVGAEDFSDNLDNIEKAIALYEKGDFSKAIQELKQVISVLKDRAEDELRNEGLFKANLYLGMSYLGEGKESLAKESFKNAIRTAPHKKLNPELFPPKVISLYNEVIAQSLSSLSVQSNVLGAEVFIDNIKKGNTPIVIHNLLTGMHTIKVIAVGQEIVRTVGLEPGKDIVITADFQNTGSINVTSEPSAATVYLNGNATGMTPLLIKDVPPGEHVLSASKEGYIESNMKVTVKVNEITDKHFKLMPIVYTVRISSVPENAKVFWDETAKGATPVTIDNTTAGVHKIRIAKEDYEELLDTIDVKAPSTEKTYLLNPHKGNLSIKTEPSGVEVIMNDRNVGLTPLNINELQVKQYTVKLKKEGYREKNIMVNITKDKTAEINETLLEIDTQPPNIIFKPFNTAIKENKNFVKATVSDNQSVREVALMLKMEGEMNFHRVDMSNPIKGMYEAVIPDLYLKKGSVLKYYILACDMQDNCTTEGSKNLPYELKVSSLEPYTEGFVLDVSWEGDTVKVIISLGSEEGVKKGETYIVFRAGKELKDPKTGDLLQIEEIFVGTIKIRELMPHTAYATVDSTVVPIVKNDRIRKVPSTPSGALTEGTHATKILLRWAPNREPEVEGYRIFRSSTIDGNYKKVGQINGRDNTFYEDTDDMREGLTFYYKITAFNILGADSLMSEPIVGKTKKVGPPPENMKVEGMKVREVHLRWDIIKQDPEIKNYIIYRTETEGGQFTEIAHVDRDTETYVDRENLKDDKTYFYKIAVKSSHGSIGELSSAVKAKTKDVPTQPQKISAISGMARMVKIQWDKHSDPDVAGYIIYRNDKEADTFTKIGKTEKTEFLDKDVSDGTIYYYSVSSFYYVRGVEIIGLSSQPVSAETKHRPKTPANVSAESGLARKIYLKWNKNEEKDIVEYWVYRGREDKLDRSPFSKVKVNTFTDTNLKDNTNYFYAVKAVDIDGLESDLSNTVSGITKSLPKPPTGLEGQASQGKLYLKWKPNEERDIKGYNVYKKGWFKNTLLTTSDQNSCEIKMEEKMKSINLYVTAIDKDGLESELSEEINIIFQ
jgi:fibronectin type 3 domain-containing protein/tetratricopeptide (TPR) repeat protein